MSFAFITQIRAWQKHTAAISYLSKKKKKNIDFSDTSHFAND